MAHYKYRFIEDLHNIHKGEEIWVLGCGPSLDNFPDDFFDEKYRIAIASTWSMIAFPNCTYTAISRGQTQFQLSYVLKYRKHLLHKHIVRLNPIELKNKMFVGPEPIYLRLREDELGGSDPIYLRIREMELGKRKFDFSSLANDLITGKSIGYSSAGTCIHCEIQAAIVMGAKKVTLAGCEAKCLKFQGHAYKRGLDKIYKESDQKRMPKEGNPAASVAGQSLNQKRIRAGNVFLANIMKPYGIEIARYYYDKGYEKIS